ncbi:D-alanine--D-alanine ligase family protein [Mangrovicella endophytica]|uniref:D-alanine--D-alanine ligase family protein n=1 Tax=Mangrovicella endophytica TaxID=2066697 RepID=UPI000C9E039F|nr:D-alanine--D-alanine ligase family protein [Mangrovicella endophytica]
MTDLPSKLRIGILFGGRSPEHEVSVMSATNVVQALDPARHEGVPIYVTRDGRWLLSGFAEGSLARPDAGTSVCLLPGGEGRLIAIEESGSTRELPKIDILFPVLHGLHGEDGSMQGLADVARVPLVGCDILGSATALDKDIAKRLLRDAGIPTARAVTIHQGTTPSFAELSAELGTPIFVKPARQGSSVGVSKVASEAELQAALTEGFRHDRKLLAEAFIKGREIECAVLEAPDGSLFVSRPGEIVPAESHGFYSYDAKYVDVEGAALKVPAVVPEAVEQRLRDLAARAFTTVGCDGMARVDFFVTAEDDILLNELNTIPGFTDISMYSKVMAASGVSYPEVIERLIAHGLARAQARP